MVTRERSSSFNLAYAQVLGGENNGALDTLNFLADMGVEIGIAVDDEGRLLLGSIRYGRILRANKSIELLSDARDAGHWSVFGMRLDRAGGLWFASAAVPQFVLAKDEKPRAVPPL